MISEEIIKQTINNTLKSTDFKLKYQSTKYVGKVRDNYTYTDDSVEKMLIITTDRISCFDVVVGTIPFKGQILNQIASFWFDKTKDIIQNHIISMPDPNAIIVKKCNALPIEMIVRAYITGSLWREYEKGERQLYGLKFNSHLKKDQRFDYPIITPTTKAQHGEHDAPISKEEIIKKGIITKQIYEQMEKISLKLFERGQKVASQNGLILVDTKYEFGLLDGKLILMDEIHTPDSSRYWYSESYEELFENGEEQKILDKEYVRQWLISKGFMGEGQAPNLPDEVKIEACMRYMKAFEQVTGRKFDASSENINLRIEKNLKKVGLIN